MHGIGGAAGAILTGVFAINEYGGTSGLIEGNGGQVVNQLIGVGIVFVYDVVVTLIILKLVDLVIGFVSAKKSSATASISRCTARRSSKPRTTWGGERGLGASRGLFYFCRRQPHHSQRIDRNPKRLRAGNKPSVEACELDIVATRTQKFDCGEMQSIQRSHRNREWPKSTIEYRGRKIDQQYAVENGVHFIGVRVCQSTRMNAIPNLVFEQTTGNQSIFGDGFRQRTIFRQKLRQDG